MAIVINSNEVNPFTDEVVINGLIFKKVSEYKKEAPHPAGCIISIKNEFNDTYDLFLVLQINTVKFCLFSIHLNTVKFCLFSIHHNEVSNNRYSDSLNNISKEEFYEKIQNEEWIIISTKAQLKLYNYE